MFYILIYEKNLCWATTSLTSQRHSSYYLHFEVRRNRCPELSTVPWACIKCEVYNLEAIFSKMHVYHILSLLYYIYKSLIHNIIKLLMKFEVINSHFKFRKRKYQQIQWECLVYMRICVWRGYVCASRWLFLMWLPEYV